MSSYYIIGIRVDNRVANAVKLQEVLTKDGCNIKTRLGLHDTSGDECATDGIVILQPYGEENEVKSMVEDLNSLEGIKARLIDLN